MHLYLISQVLPKYELYIDRARVPSYWYGYINFILIRQEWPYTDTYRSTVYWYGLSDYILIWLEVPLYWYG